MLSLPLPKCWSIVVDQGVEEKPNIPEQERIKIQILEK